MEKEYEEESFGDSGFEASSNSNKYDSNMTCNVNAMSKCRDSSGNENSNLSLLAAASISDEKLVNEIYLPSFNSYIKTLGNSLAQVSSAWSLEEDTRKAKILSKCYTPDEDGDVYLHRYICQGKMSEAKSIILITPDTRYLDFQNNDLQTALHLAAALNHVDVLRMLIERGAQINLTDRHGNNVFHIIADSGNMQVLQATLTLESVPQKRHLIHLKAALDAQNHQGVTPLFIAVHRKHADVCYKLAMAGANVNVPDRKNGNSPLLEAVKLNSTQLVDLLVRRCHANVNQPNFCGVTPLHYAAGIGLDSIAALLMMHGADLNMEDEQNCTALQYSLTDDVAKLLCGRPVSTAS